MMSFLKRFILDKCQRRSVSQLHGLPNLGSQKRRRPVERFQHLADKRPAQGHGIRSRILEIRANSHFGNRHRNARQYGISQFTAHQCIRQYVPDFFGNTQLALTGATIWFFRFTSHEQRSFYKSLERPLHSFDFEALDLVAFLDVLIVLEGHTAFLTGDNLFHLDRKSVV